LLSLNYDSFNFISTKVPWLTHWVLCCSIFNFLCSGLWTIVYLCVRLLALYCYVTGIRGRDRMVVGFITTYALSAYHHWCLWVRISIRARCTTVCNKVCQWLATGRWFSPDPPVSSTNKTDRHDIAEILLKVVLNTIKQANKHTAAVPNW